MGNVKNIASLTIIICLLMGTLTGCYLMPKEEVLLAPPLVQPAQITYDVVEAKKGTIEKKISGSGTFISVEQSSAYFTNRGGRLKEVLVKIGDEVEKGQVIAELNTDNIETDIKLQKIALKRAQLSYDRAKESGSDKYGLEMAKLDVDAAKIRLNDLERELKETKLYSPISGKIVYVDNKINPGDYVNAYSSIVYIADPKKLQLQYSGASVSEFKVGMKVDVVINNDTYEGETVMTPANAPKDADESVKSSVRIEVKDLPEDIEMGDSANVHLTLEKKENVIVVPKQAVQNFVGRKFVRILEDDVKKERDVEVGLETQTEVEIRKGLNEGEQVILQ